MRRNGWTLLFHPCMSEQIREVHQASERARRTNPEGAETNANVKLFAAMSRLMLDVIPDDPARKAYRQGKTLAPDTGTGAGRSSHNASACSSASTPNRR